VIAVIDYGVANVGSMLNMLRRVGAQVTLAADAAAIDAASKLILPGIGAFDQGMDALSARGLIPRIRQRVLEDKVPILGVCLGVQLLGQGSAEGTREGLGLIEARCERLPGDASAGVRIPHMGWNHIRALRPNPLLDGLDADARFYFVHSYHVVCSRATDVLATARHGIDFTAMVQRENIYGAQFHPEKSHRFGMRLLQNFVGL
jgi:imidazole glycerol-phosphate synthase subunit HisH